VATTAQLDHTRPPPRQADRARDARFFASLAAALAAVTLLAFSTTYLLPVAAGRFSAPAILHVHGVLFLAWPAWLLAQSLASDRSRKLHRALGLGGIALATAMVFSGLLAIGSSIESWTARGVGPAAQVISIVAFSGIVLFAGLFVAAIRAIGDRASHARYMLLATLAIMQGASGRLALVALLRGNPDYLRPGLLPPPDSLLPVMIVHLVFDALILAILLAYDWRTVGRPHRATLIGGGALVVVIATRHLFVDTPLWAAIAGWLAGL
jgi:hypothetical protein